MGQSNYCWIDWFQIYAFIDKILMLQPPLSHPTSFASSVSSMPLDHYADRRNSPRSQQSSRSLSEIADAVNDLGGDSRGMNFSKQLPGMSKKHNSVRMRKNFEPLQVKVPQKIKKHDTNMDLPPRDGNPFKANSCGLKHDEVFKKYDPVPSFLDQIGMTAPGMPPIFVQLTKSLAGGMISRYDAFRNIFDKDMFAVPAGQPDDSGRMDRKDQVKELLSCTKSCYPTQDKSNRELELENFSREIVATINVVFKRCQKDLGDLPVPRGTNIQPSSPSKAPPQSRKESLKSMLGDFSLQNRLDIESGTAMTQQGKPEVYSTGHLYDRINALEIETEALQAKLDLQEQQTNKMRRDYTRDLQNLRNALSLAVDPIDRRHAETVKLTIHVYNFNDLEGLSPELVALFNEKLLIVKEEAQIQIDKVTQNVHSLVERIEKYKSLKPETFQLLELPIMEIFEAVHVIEPLAFPVWQQFISSFPPDHFSQIIKQVAEQMNQDQDDTYEKLIAMMHEGIFAGSIQIDKMIDDLRDRFKIQQTELEKAREETNMEMWRSSKAIDEMEKKLTANHNTFLKEEIARMNMKFQQEVRQKETLIEFQVREIDRLKRGKENSDLRVVIFKWRMVGKFSRFIDELEAEYLDKDSLRDMLHQDMQKLFFGNELHQLSNSLQAGRQMQKQIESALKTQTAEGHDLRIKVNTLLVDRNKNLNQIEKQKVIIWDLNKMLDAERKKREDANFDVRVIKDQQKAISDLLSHQIRLKEAFEDKLRNTLDIRHGGITFDNLVGGGKEDNPPVPGFAVDTEFVAERKRQEETKKVVLGFQVELQSKLYRNRDELALRKKAAEDINYRETQLSVECQTEIHSAISRKLDLTIINANPVRPETIRVPMSDQGNMTDISTNVIDFMANGSQKYETVMAMGLIRAVDVSVQKLNEQTVGEYIQTLKEQEEENGAIFNARMKTVTKQLASFEPLTKGKLVSRQKSLSSHFVRQSSHALGSKLNIGKLRTKSGIVTPVDEEEQNKKRSSPTGSSKVSPRKVNKPSITKVVESRASKFAMSPINATKGSVSDSELNQTSSDESSLITDEDFEDSNRDLKTDLKIEPMTQAPDYRAIVERKNAETIFSSYVNLSEIIMQMDGKLYRTAVRTLKKQKGPNFKLDQFAMKRYKKLYPELIPDVFWRLWDKEKDEKQLQEKRQLIIQAKQAWNQKLRDQGRLKEAESYFDGEMRMVSDTATNLEVSVPYLNPININISQDGSPDLVKEQDLTEKKSKQHLKQGTRKKQAKKVSVMRGAKKQQRQQYARVNSVMTDPVESTQIDSPSRLKDQQKTAAGDGVFGLPKSQYDIKVSICPKPTTTTRQSIQLTKCAPLPQQKRVQIEVSPHFSFQKPEISSATNYPGVKTSSLLSRSQKVAKQAQQAKVSVSKPLTTQQSPLMPPRRDDTGSLLQVPTSENVLTYNTVDNRVSKGIYSPMSFNPSEPTGLHTNIMVGEQQINKKSLFCMKKGPGQQKLKRPATCKSKSSAIQNRSRMNNTATLNTVRVLRTMENVTSQDDARSTHQETTSYSSKPFKDVLYGTLQELREASLRQTEDSMLSTRHRQAGNNKPCPIKAFDMRTIPVNQQDQMRSSLLLNFKNGSSRGVTMSQVLDQKRNMQARRSRAQSATFSKNVMKQARQASGILLNNLTIESGMDRSQPSGGDICNPRTVKINNFPEVISSENHNQGGPGQTAGMRTSTQVIVTQSSVEASIKDNNEDDDYNPVSSHEDLPKVKVLCKKEPLIKVNDQLEVD